MANRPTENRLSSFFDSAKRRAVIVGTNPLVPAIEESAAYFQNLLGAERDLSLAIFYESDNENFSQSVASAACAGIEDADSASYAELNIHRDRVKGTQAYTGLAREIEELAPDNAERGSYRRRITISELHLRLPANIIVADDRLWYSLIGVGNTAIEGYVEAQPTDAIYGSLMRFVDSLTSDAVSVYLSKPGDELIWVYDRSGVARGIFPRAAFYTTRYARYSVWGLVFNRKGQLLLQRRSRSTKDNRGMWDKSIGGHVDLVDSSTGVTAKRELIEEMYLPRAEFTKHMRADLGDIIDFGEWNPRKRPERYFREEVGALGDDDWIMFRAMDPQSDLPLTVNRISERLWHDSDDAEPRIRRTVFISDVYFFIAPPGQLESNDSLRRDLAEDEHAAADDRELVSVSELVRAINEAERDGSYKSTYTDDLLYLSLEHRELLEGIAAFATYLGG